jgi:GT2 family glycosyltransferase
MWTVSASDLTSIIIPNYNGLFYLEQCVGSIRTHTEQPYELIVVDSGSTDGSDRFCITQGIDFVSIPNNPGFPSACNWGLKAASGSRLLLLNNDVIVTRHWLELLTQCLNSEPTVGMVGPVTNYASGRQQISEPYTSLEDMTHRYNRADPSQWQESSRIIGMCLLLKREVMDRVGLLDERFNPGHYEDDDYCLRVRQAGYRLMIAGNVFVYHHGSASFGAQDAQWLSELVQTNRAKFINKWGFEPG